MGTTQVSKSAAVRSRPEHPIDVEPDHPESEQEKDRSHSTQPLVGQCRPESGDVGWKICVSLEHGVAMAPGGPGEQSGHQECEDDEDDGENIWDQHSEHLGLSAYRPRHISARHTIPS